MYYMLTYNVGTRMSGCLLDAVFTVGGTQCFCISHEWTVKAEQQDIKRKSTIHFVVKTSVSLWSEVWETV